MSAHATVLIIDDDPLHLTLYTWILAREGFKTKTTLVGSADVELPSSEIIDLVLLDYRLNGSRTAAQVAEQVRSVFPSAPIVVLSELPWMPDDVRSYAAAFVNKGDPQKLIAAITSVLQTKHSGS